MKRLVIAAVILVAALFLIVQSGSHLVVDRPEKSDAILVLAGDRNDVRYWRSLELLRAGYGRQMVLDESTERMFGRSYAEHAAEFAARTAGEQTSSISVCVIRGDSTLQETTDAGRCLAQLQPPPHTVLIVTNDFHTRRALSIFHRRLPQYQWSAAAASDNTVFGLPWWKKREWAKTNLTEWQKLLWWEVFEQWRS
ncbi:MAG: ElyC/SanA/YdcF family protein [Candidatus Korobacteraceae bacterium]